MAKKTTRFRIAKKGYDRFEVDSVLSQNELELSELKTKLQVYKSQVEVAQQQLESVKERYDDLVSKLSVREKAADEISRIALKEANTVIDTANQNADTIVMEALTTAKILLSELAKVTQETNSAKGEMKEKIDLLQKTLDELKLPEIPSIQWLDKEKESED